MGSFSSNCPLSVDVFIPIYLFFIMSEDKGLIFDNLTREEAGNKVINLPRNKEFVVDILSDGQKIYIRTDGA